MMIPDLAKIVADSWPSVVGILVGTLISHKFTVHRRSDIRYIRGLGGRALNRFADIPASVLDAELLSAAQLGRRGWRGVAAYLNTPILLWIALLSAAVFRETFPQVSGRGLLSALLCGLIAGIGTWLFQRRERQFILHYLSRLHPPDRKD